MSPEQFRAVQWLTASFFALLFAWRVLDGLQQLINAARQRNADLAEIIRLLRNRGD